MLGVRSGAPVTRPEHRGIGGAKLGKGGDCGGHIIVGHVAEHSAGENEVGRDQARVRVGESGVGLVNLDLVQPESSDPLASNRDVALLELDQVRSDSCARWMRRKNPDQVIPLTAQRLRIDRSLGGRGIE